MSHNLMEMKTQFLEYIEIERGRAIKTVENYDHYLSVFLDYTKISNPSDITSEKFAISGFGSIAEVPAITALLETR